MSGYCACACRDCFETAIAGDDEEATTLCGDCEEAGCDPEEECQAPGAYGQDQEDETTTSEETDQ